MTGNRYGILIANQDYAEDSGFHPLKCPLNDAAALRDVLLDPDHGEFAEVTILPDKTRSEILLKLEEALEKAEREDLVFIYFSGHGKTDRKGNLYFAASNTKADRLRATGINGRDIADVIHESNVSKKALVLDCCYAGAMAKGFKGAADVAQDRVDEFAKGAGTYVLMATGELSLAAEDPEEGMSVLTRYLVEGLRGDADVNRDGIITLNELSRYVQRQVIHFHDQKPTEAGLGIQGEVAISKSGHEPEKERREKIRACLDEWTGSRAITYRIASQAEEILDMGTDLPDEAARQRRLLLDRVVTDGLSSGAFLEKWLKLGRFDKAPVAQPEPPTRPKPPPSEPPRSEGVGPGSRRPARDDAELVTKSAATKKAPGMLDGIPGALGVIVLAFLAVLGAFGIVIEAMGLYDDTAWIVSAAGLVVAFLMFRYYRTCQETFGRLAKLLLGLGILATLAVAIGLFLVSAGVIR